MSIGVIVENHNQLSEEPDEFELLNQALSSGDLICACAVCHKVRDSQGNWHTLTIDLKEIKANLTHGFCPNCLRKQYAQLEEFIRRNHQGDAP